MRLTNLLLFVAVLMLYTTLHGQSQSFKLTGPFGFSIASGEWTQYTMGGRFSISTNDPSLNNQLAKASGHIVRITVEVVK